MFEIAGGILIAIFVLFVLFVILQNFETFIGIIILVTLLLVSLYVFYEHTNTVLIVLLFLLGIFIIYHLEKIHTRCVNRPFLKNEIDKKLIQLIPLSRKNLVRVIDKGLVKDSVKKEKKYSIKDFDIKVTEITEDRYFKELTTTSVTVLDKSQNRICKCTLTINQSGQFEVFRLIEDLGVQSLSFELDELISNGLESTNDSFIEFKELSIRRKLTIFLNELRKV